MIKKLIISSLIFTLICSNFSNSQNNAVKIVPKLQIGQCIDFKSHYELVKSLKIMSIEPKEEEAKLKVNTILPSIPILGDSYSDTREKFRICLLNYKNLGFQLSINGESNDLKPSVSSKVPEYAKSQYSAIIDFSGDNRKIQFSKYTYDGMNLLPDYKKSAENTPNFAKQWIGERFLDVYNQEITESMGIFDQKSRMSFKYICVFRECNGNGYSNHVSAIFSGVQNSEFKFDLHFVGKELKVAFLDQQKVKAVEWWKPTSGSGEIVFSPNGFLKRSQSSFYINGSNTYVIPNNNKPITLKVLQQFRIIESTTSTQ